MSPQGILDHVCRAVDVLVAAGESHGGLFPSLLDRETHRMITHLPKPIPGQRQSDRSHPGSNLIHDEATLKTAYALSDVLGRDDLARASDRYLERFATHCTATVTGLFPWGEHSFWHLLEDRVGCGYTDVAHPDRPRTSAVHDHLRQAPLWLWEKLHAFSPACVERFAEGLHHHWTEGEPQEYIRHGYIDVKEPYPRGARSCDFPRHSGFYIFDWAFAWLKTARDEFLKQIETMLDYWWSKRGENGLLRIESRSPETDTRFHNTNAPAQTVSLAASLLESAVLLAEKAPELARTMRERARVYLDGFFQAPHDLERGILAVLSRCETNDIVEATPVWGSRYGLWPASYVALTCLCAFRLTDDRRLLGWAAAVGKNYCRTPLAAGVAVPAMDAGLGLGLLADLYDITGNAGWLEGGLALAHNLLGVYLGKDLPRGAAGVGWYESQMGPGFLLHGLARVALLAMDRSSCPLEADYTAR